MTTCSIEGCDRKHYAQTWCATHWQRNRRYGDPQGGGVLQQPRGTECSVNGCMRPVAARGWCATHYYRWKKHGDPQAGVPIVEKLAWRRGKWAVPRECAVPACARKATARGWCGRHYSRWRRYGDPEAPPRRGQNGTGYRMLNSDGYVVLKLRGATIMEHRTVMEEKLGRMLLPGETVHHMNGIRTDNRPENLELWVSTRSGQRVADLITFVVERYRSDVEAALNA